MFILLILVITGALLFHLRAQNKVELSLLEIKHKEMQLAVKNYLNDMSRVKINDNESSDNNSKVYEYNNQIKVVEEKINEIKRLWFLE